MPPARYKDLASRAPALVKSVVAAPYQAKHKSLPCEPTLTQAYIAKIEALPKGAQHQEYRAAVKWAIAEGLLEELDIRQEENGQTKLHFTITPLGERFIQELCRIKKL